MSNISRKDSRFGRILIVLNNRPFPINTIRFCSMFNLAICKKNDLLLSSPAWMFNERNWTSVIPELT